MSSAQKLKRNISADPQKEAPLKKHKARKPFDDVRFKTPHATLLSQSEVYKLPSSVGPYVSPSDFSPIPNRASYQGSIRKTSSTNLKENSFTSNSPVVKSRPVTKKYGRSRRKQPSKKKSGLESPFNSCSSTSSPRSSSESIHAPNFKRTLSDNVFSPGHVKSASQSQVYGNVPDSSPTRPRRPSAPTPPRIKSRNYPPVLNCASAFDLHDPHTPGSIQPTLGPSDDFQTFFRAPSNTSLDWARPPSRASLFDCSGTYTLDDRMDLDIDNSVSGDEFFASARATSTPFKRFESSFTPGGTVDPAIFTTRDIPDTDSDSEDDENSSKSGSSLKIASRKRMKRSSGYATPNDSDAEEDSQDSIFGGGRSPWISDSLISPPNTMEWKASSKVNENHAYMQVPSEPQSEDVEMSEMVLQDMFDTLVLAEAIESPSREYQQVPRTRSVDNVAHPPERDTEASSPILRPVFGTRRTRSGTVVPPLVPTAQAPPSFLTRRTRSGTITSNNDSAVGGTRNHESTGTTLAPALPVVSVVPHRTRSGTVVSGPSGPASFPAVEDRSPSSGTSLAVHNLSVPVGPGKSARTGSVVATTSLAPVGEIFDSFTSSSPRNRIANGSIVALEASIDAAISSLPEAGIRTRNRTVTVNPGPTLDLVVEQGAVSSSSIRNQTNTDNTHGDNTFVEQPVPTMGVSTSTTAQLQVPSRAHDRVQDIDEEDPLNIMDLPLSFGTSQSASKCGASTSSPVQASRPTLGLRAKAKAVASKAKGMGMMGLTNKKGKDSLRARHEMARIVDYLAREEESDDELLLKPGDIIS
ncbi:hypothetical protein K435DRAFT_967472 [Dendrothele bispora CBS 962.96]|uniref:Uncharacterized protein n=1 Tax=Dendrothele bispora (strain CBS 962.96) TaxID=1314807 RepID=A0A4S8LTW1_DENBC|nr:hypothetical protein K435DRAFT_967472 [Dendrothele bispora CBS 962.96]